MLYIDSKKSRLEKYEQNKEEINLKLKTKKEGNTNYRYIMHGDDWESAVNYAKIW